MKPSLFANLFLSTATLFSQVLPASQVASSITVGQVDNCNKPLCLPLLRARYQWSYVGINNREKGSGVLDVLVDPDRSRVVLELYSFGERLVLLDGDDNRGYRLCIPRYGINQKVSTLSMVPIPIFSNMVSPDAFYQLLVNGSGEGVKVINRDVNGPVKLQYSGFDENGSVIVRLKRIRWKLGKK